MSTTPPAPSPLSPPSPPATPSAPPPAIPSAPPPAIPSAPPPAIPSAPPPATPSAPPPAIPSAPPPATPSAPPPSTPSVSPPPTPSVTPPSTPSVSPPPPSTPSESPPSPSTPSVSPPQPSTPSESPPSPSTPPSTPSPPAQGGRSLPTLNPSPPLTRTPPSGRSPPSPPKSSDSISTPAIVGIAVGAVAIVAVLGLIFVFCCRKKRRHQPPLEYYGGPPPPLRSRKDDSYDGQPQNWQLNAPPPVDHIVKLPPRPPVFPSPPRPLVYTSSGGSGSNYSGSKPLPPPSPGFTPGYSKSTFTFEELALATNGFSDSNLLGQGGFGYVHKGVLPNGKEVAIKQLKLGSGQGEREFQAEVEIINRVHHKHLVSLVGYCMSGDRRLLVYEYVPNKTLEFHLHGKDRPTMDWSTRLKIALGSAKGLAYLHEDCHPKIIHRDIKAANILLDFNFEAMVADFGLAKFASDNNTHISTRVMGTFGYMAPEYASSGKLTDRSDVFSYGVMLLELVTGKRPVDSTQTYTDDSLVDWARPLLTRAMEEGNYEALIDPRLGRNYNPNEMTRMVACAASCVRHSAKRRPKMSQIVRALEGAVSLDDLDEGVRPGHSTVHGSSYGGSTDYDSSQYNEDMKKFRKMALASRDYTSSEYSAPTSEYGQIASGSSSEGRHTREIELGKK